MRLPRPAVYVLLGIAPLLTLGKLQAQDTTSVPLPPPVAIETPATLTFAFTHTLMIAGTPTAIFDALTGDISGWWDHTFSQKPKRLFIEPKPGGGFYEIFDGAGNGVRHATVRYAERGKQLVFEGPLAFVHDPLTLVFTYTLSAVGDSTKLTLIARGAGVMAPEIPKAIEGVWRHFLFGRFKPYFERRSKRGSK